MWLSHCDYFLFLSLHECRFNEKRNKEKEVDLIMCIHHSRGKRKKQVRFSQTHTQRSFTHTYGEKKRQGATFGSLNYIYILTREEAKEKTKDEAHIGVFGSLFHCFFYIGFWFLLDWIKLYVWLVFFYNLEYYELVCNLVFYFPLFSHG